MKNIVIYSLLLVTLGSCGMSTNFNSQKFTSLKKIKPAQKGVDIKNQLENETDHYAYTSELKTEERAPFSAHSDFISDQESQIESANLSLSSVETQTTNYEKDSKEPLLPTHDKASVRLNEDPVNSADEKKENNMFYWMMALFILAAPASIFIIIPAIPIYLAAFILAILLLRRINSIDSEKQTQKQKRRKKLAVWVLVHWAIGLGLAGLYIFLDS